MTTPTYIESGDPRAPIWLIGEAPGEDEVASRRPFTGPSGRELDRMLHEAGINRADCFATNVCHERPPSYMKNAKWIHNDINQFFATKTTARVEHLGEVSGRFPRPPIQSGLSRLHNLLTEHHPNLLICLGNTPMWALGGQVGGITKWRGSVFRATATGHKCLCTFHPADVLRTWEHRPIVVQDFRRAAREAESPTLHAPNWRFTIPRTVADVSEWFHTHLPPGADMPVIADTEGYGRVDCIGFAVNTCDAICIPFTNPTATSPDDCHYWSPSNEYAVSQLCRTALSAHLMTFHNALWDCQITARRWAMMPRLADDTMVAQHVAWPGLLGGKIDPVTGDVDKKGSSLSLSFCASMYCEHYCYWKDDGRHWNPEYHTPEQYWRYNCEDCVRTYEVRDALLGEGGVIDARGLRAQYDFIMRLYAPTFAMMFRGINYNATRASLDARYLAEAAARSRQWIETALGCSFNPDSTPQMKALFYDDLNLTKRLNRKTKAVTLDDATLDTIGRQTPLLAPLVQNIQNYRTCDTLRGSLGVKVSNDGRIRSALNPAFVETFRFSSNSTAFGEGGNLQNIKRPDND